MKKILTILSIVFSFSLNAQVTVTNATSPNFNDGVVSVDTTGTQIKKWAVYKVFNGYRQDPEISMNSTLTTGLSVGTYWVLGKKNTDDFSKFSLDTLINVSIAVVKNCDSLKVTFFNSMQMPDPMNPQNPPSTCISYGIAKATNPLIDKIYTQEGNLPIQTYYGPNQGNCFMNLSSSTKLYVVFKDDNGCSVVGTNAVEYKPTNYPVMTVPGTEPGPITNHVTIGVADCSGYYIHYNNVQYKICNSGAARSIVHLDSIIVSGSFVPNCNYVDTVVFCQMYHPFVGYFWLDSVKKIEHSLSINELDFNTSFYPNPFNESLKISNSVNSTIKIYNIIGNLIFDINGKDVNINTTDFVKGNYILEVTNDNSSYRKMIIKN